MGNATTITELQPHQVFVFGSNADGFHGAGAAGMAMRGDSRNTWRYDSAFLRAKDSPVGSPHRKGKWAVYGIARGYQEGNEGKSYAIQTIKKPGFARSTPLSEIKLQLLELFQFASLHPHLEFLMTPIGCGYSGYTPEQMLQIWEEVCLLHPIPPNIVAPEGLFKN